MHKNTSFLLLLLTCYDFFTSISLASDCNDKSQLIKSFTDRFLSPARTFLQENEDVETICCNGHLIPVSRSIRDTDLQNGLEVLVDHLSHTQVLVTSRDCKNAQRRGVLDLSDNRSQANLPTPMEEQGLVKGVENKNTVEQAEVLDFVSSQVNKILSTIPASSCDSIVLVYTHLGGVNSRPATVVYMSDLQILFYEVFETRRR